MLVCSLNFFLMLFWPRLTRSREELNRNGKLATIIFIRMRNSKQQEVSGYIDYAQRLQFEDMEPYFSCKRNIVPRPTDLSFYNWETQMSATSSSVWSLFIVSYYTEMIFYFLSSSSLCMFWYRSILRLFPIYNNKQFTRGYSLSARQIANMSMLTPRNLPVTTPHAILLMTPHIYK